jgi:hypothetical protein
MTSDKVFVLAREDAQNAEFGVMGVFRKREDAVAMKNRYIREEFDIGNEEPDASLDRFVDNINSDIHFTINTSYLA